MLPAPQTIQLRPPCLCQHLSESGQTAHLPDSWTHHLHQEWAVNLLGFQAGTRGAGEGRPAEPLALPLGTRTASQGFLLCVVQLSHIYLACGDGAGPPGPGGRGGFSEGHASQGEAPWRGAVGRAIPGRRQRRGQACSRRRGSVASEPM